MPDETPPTRVVVELVSSADVKRLEDADKDLRKEIADLRRQLEGLTVNSTSFWKSLDRLPSDAKRAGRETYPFKNQNGGESSAPRQPPHANRGAVNTEGGQKVWKIRNCQFADHRKMSS